jgi:fibronectin-binding autotransporter adhesin
VSVSAGAQLVFDRSNSFTVSMPIVGAGSISQIGTGTLVLANTSNSYTGGTTITNGGTIQISNDGNLGATSSTLTMDNGTLATTASFATSRTVTLNTGGGTLNVASGTTLTDNGLIADGNGAGALTKTGTGTLVLTGAKTYSGGTAINGGVVQVSADNNLGAATGGLSFNGGTLSDTATFSSSRPMTFNAGGGTIDVATGQTLTLTGATTGSGGLNKIDVGTLVLAGASNYTGATQVTNGSLYIDGSTTSAATVATGATLGGTGAITGDVALNGGTLAPGSETGAVGTLTINGNLTMTPTSSLNYTFGQLGGAAQNDLVNVNGNLQVAGSLNLTNPAGGTFLDGVYRVFNYTGALNDQGLTLGSVPPGTTLTLQTVVPNQINLINTTGQPIAFWDGGDPAKYNNGVVDGGNGVWNTGVGANQNWTDANGSANTSFTNGFFAVFQGAVGTVTVDDSLGQVIASGMQFVTSGYLVNGQPITLTPTNTGSNLSQLNVGDGSPASAGTVATIGAVLQGSATLEKVDFGTLILTGVNTYTGGTAIDGGTLQISADNNLGAPSGALSFNGGTLNTTANITTPRPVTLNASGGTVDVNPSTVLTLTGSINGTGALTKTDSGTLVLTGANTYTGGTFINAGAVQVSADANLGGPSGGLTFTGAGTLADAGTFSSLRTVTLSGAGTTATFAVAAGQTLTLAGVISGAGALTKTDSGRLVLTGAETYTGTTTVSAGALYVDGSTTSATNVASGATLGGTGIIGGSMTAANGGTLAPGSRTGAIGALTIKGDLTLNPGSTLNYRFGQANVVGGPLNDLTNVNGHLTLAGTLNVATAPGGSFDPGVYRVIDYSGSLTDNGLAIGTAPAPASQLSVQTSIAGQVNLIYTGGLTFNWWDGGLPGNANNGVVDGGDGVWQSSAGNSNWTNELGSPNGAWANQGFAVFEGQPGTVTVDDSLGPVTTSGMQFITSGYAVNGNPITLVPTVSGSNLAQITVDDGTGSNPNITATINAALQGSTGLEKLGVGRLVLGGANTYAGGTAIDQGALQISADNNLGAAGTSLTFNGTPTTSATLAATATFSSGRPVTLNSAGGVLDVGNSTTLTLNGVIDGTGALTKTDTGTLILNGVNTYSGGTVINDGAVQVSADANLGATGTGLTFNGNSASTTPATLATTATFSSGRPVTLNSAGGMFDVANSTTLTLTGAIAGGGLTKVDTGTLVLTGANTYTGPTTVSAGSLYVDGSTTSATSVASGATLGGTGTIGGSVTVASGGTLTPGSEIGAIGALTINGSLTLNSGSTLKYSFGQANVVGGSLNDLTNVNGNLTLAGTLNVATTPGGSFNPGLYRIFSYTGFADRQRAWDRHGAGAGLAAVRADLGRRSCQSGLFRRSDRGLLGRRRSDEQVQRRG